MARKYEPHKSLLWGWRKEPIEPGHLWGDTEKALGRLFHDPKFLDEIYTFRIANKIPEKDGWEDIDDFIKYKAKPQQKKKVRAEATRIAKKRNLPKPYIDWIEIFIGLGFGCVEYVGPFEKKGILRGDAYEMEIKKDHVAIRMYTGASIKGLTRFLRSLTFVLEPALKDSRLGKAPSVRKKSLSKIERNKKIFELHTQGLFGSDGTWKGVWDEQPDFSKGISLDQRRKIIQTQKRVLKAKKKVTG